MLKVPTSADRSPALGNLRLCLTLLVVLHHVVLAYCRYARFDRQHYLWSSAPIVDRHRSIAFVIQDFDGTYFMSLMFGNSGLFVLWSLQRKGPSRYRADRLLRLGLPFVVCVTLIMPLAYYPSYLQTGARLSFTQFWAGYFTDFGWPAGPAWFLWLLLAFDLATCATVLFLPALPRCAASMPDRLLARPAPCLGIILAAAVMSYLPMLNVFGSSRWFTLGPFAVQSSRIGLYALFFCCGAALGAAGLRHPLLDRDGPLAKAWIGCGLSALVAFALLVALQLAVIHRTSHWPPAPSQEMAGLLFVLCCVLASTGLTGLFLRHLDRSSRWPDALTASAYGIYLIVTWTQTALLRLPWIAVVKMSVVLAVTLSLSWSVIACARRLETFRRVL